MRYITVKQYNDLPIPDRPPALYAGQEVRTVYVDPSYPDGALYVIRLPSYGAGSKLASTLLELEDEPGEYSVILSDPPWPYAFSNVRAKDTPDDYPRMTIEEIKSLRPPASENCALFLWACWPLLPQAIEVITAWGFTYKTIAWVWVKLNPSGNGYWNGMGAIRANSEPCLLAVRGRMPVQTHDVSALIVAPIGYDHSIGRQIHSAKPDEQYNKIARLYPRGNRLEMFARQRREGWEVHGNEVKDGIIIEPSAYPKPEVIGEEERVRMGILDSERAEEFDEQVERIEEEERLE